MFFMQSQLNHLKRLNSTTLHFNSKFFQPKNQQRLVFRQQHLMHLNSKNHLNAKMSSDTEQVYRFSDVYQLANFLDIQKKSFQSFLKKGLIQEFNLQDMVIPTHRYRVPFLVDPPLMDFIFYPEYYKLKPPKLDVKQAMLARKTYSSDLYIPIQLVNYRHTRFFFDWFCVATVPLMTSNGHFIINGLPRIIMSQIVRSPGVYFKKNYRTNRKNYYYTADFIAQRGSWLRLEADTKLGEVWVKIKNAQKIPFIIFLRGLGLSLPLFNSYCSIADYNRFEKPERGKKPRDLDTNFQGLTRHYFKESQLMKTHYILDKAEEALENQKALHAKNELQIVSNKKFFNMFSDKFRLLSAPINQQSTFFNSLNNPLVTLPQMIQKKVDVKLSLFEIEKLKEVKLQQGTLVEQLSILNTMLFNYNLGRPYILSQRRYASMQEMVDRFFYFKFLNKRTYNLSFAGRAKINQTLGIKVPLNHTLLTEQDLIFACFYLLECVEGTKDVSDIDHLKNRKIKPVGELLQNQVAIGLTRLKKILLEKLPDNYDDKGIEFLHMWENYQLFPTSKRLTSPFKKALFTYINPQPINSAIQEFFGTNPLSQMLDQTNPLAEMTHKRRLSSLGIGGVNRQNAGMDIRGIHPTHYGRICPIETPEGQNAGLVNSFTIYAQLNEFGFIQTPFYETYKGFLLREKGPALFLADQENVARIAPGDMYINKFNFLPQGVLLPSRQVKTFQRVNRSDINYIALNPLQMISIATSLIPFLEHDDGNRALMGSNMQRQAVPTLQPTVPIVGTGLESKIISDINHSLRAKESGFISYVDSQKIYLYSPESTSKDHSTSFNHKHQKTQSLKENFLRFKLSLQDHLRLKKKPDRSLFKHQPMKPVHTNFIHHPFFQQKTVKFNLIFQQTQKHSLSFLTLFQIQNVLQKNCSSDHLSIISILSLLSKQKQYEQKKNKFMYFNKYFSVCLNDPTFYQQKIFLNSAHVFLNDSFSLSNPVLLNAHITNSFLNQQEFYKKNQSNKPNVSVFTKLRDFTPQKEQRPFLPTHVIRKNETSFRFLSLVNKQLISFFEPSLFQSPQQNVYFVLFLRNWAPLEEKNLLRQSVNLYPNKLRSFVPIELSEYQNRVNDLIMGSFTKAEQRFVSFKPQLYKPSLIKSPQKKDARFTRMNQSVQNSVLSVVQNKKNKYLQKTLFYQNLFTKNSQQITSLNLNKVSYLPLTNIKKILSLLVKTNSFVKAKTLTSKNRTLVQTITPTPYLLDNISRSNQDTYLLHRPIVQQGQWVEKGDILADNSSSSKGELAIGQNLLVGYTPWEGYNFEDAVLLSDRVLKEELFSSLHVERYEVDVRDTSYGIEEITNILPSKKIDVSCLNKNGIVKVGTWVEEGDILVGKIAPLKKEKSQLSNYEQLLYDIMEKEVAKFRDTSLRVPPNVHGRVVHVEIIETIDDLRQVAALEAEEKKAKTKTAKEQKAKIKTAKAKKLETKKDQEYKKVKQTTKNTLNDKKLLKTNVSNQTAKMKRKEQPKTFTEPMKTSPFNYLNFSHQSNVRKSRILRPLKTKKQSTLLKRKNKSKTFDFALYVEKPIQNLSRFPFSLLKERAKKSFFSRNQQNDCTVFSHFTYSRLSFNDLLHFSSKTKYVAKAKKKMKKKTDSLANKEKIGHTSMLKKSILKRSGLSQLPPRRPKKVNIYIAEKRKLQIGDKIAGRHGNKGIISNILPQQDMPYLPDGTPLDLVLNPLGVPSRMNVGQIFECLLGLAGSYLHQTYKIQPFDELYGCEASRSLVYSKLYEARIKTKQNWLFDPNFPGKVRLFDGRTGQCFEQPVTVGKAYILKLIHLVDEKIHARSTGPYSLVTQQPLRGRSKKGGQRVGEMEVWALEGFGAAYILQELLTIKSDDVIGRSFLLTRILEDKPFTFGPPESFRVLLRELQALCLDIGIYNPYTEENPNPGKLGPLANPY